MSGHKARFSALPVLQFCGQSQRLGESLGAGRAAAIGTAFHAKCSNHPELENILARLTDDERMEVDCLIKPTEIEVHGVTLTYEIAQKEVPLAITADGRPCDPDDENALIRGTPDLDWTVLNPETGQTTLYMADIKKTIHAAKDGAYSLQIIGYAIARAAKIGADYYATGVWDATEGEWEWSALVDTWSSKAVDNWNRVKAAALNHGGEYSLGTHCTGCYGRKRCPQWLLPLDLAETSLAPFTQPDAITNGSAKTALLLAKRAEDTAEVVRDILKHYARESGGVRDHEAGKIWAPVPVKGRATFDAKRFEKDNPELAREYTKIGKGHEQFRWVNDK